VLGRGRSIQLDAIALCAQHHQFEPLHEVPATPGDGREALGTIGAPHRIALSATALRGGPEECERAANACVMASRSIKSALSQVPADRELDRGSADLRAVFLNLQN
jgi:hypothetical protein